MSENLRRDFLTHTVYTGLYKTVGATGIYVDVYIYIDVVIVYFYVLISLCFRLCSYAV